jgi:hypothetical protein
VDAAERDELLPRVDLGHGVVGVVGVVAWLERAPDEGVAAGEG